MQCNSNRGWLSVILCQISDRFNREAFTEQGTVAIF